MIADFLSLALQAITTFAAEPPDVPCPDNLDCNGGGTNVLMSVAEAIALFALRLSVGLSLVFVLYGALLMVISQGDEGQIGKGKSHIQYAIVGLAVALMAQNIYSFVYDVVQNVNPNDAIFGGILPGVASAIVTVFNPLFFISIIVAGIRMVLDRGKDQEFGKAKTALLWSCAGAVVINVAYSLIKAVMGILSGANGL